jgi:ATP:cob(I)alamin adenosyltransferase
MSIITKRGDDGYTDGIDGKRVLKSSREIRFSALIEETVSAIGIARSYILDPNINDFLSQVQGDILDLMLIDDNKIDSMLASIENFIIVNENSLNLNDYIIPGESPVSAYLYHARSQIRKLEIGYIRFFGRTDKKILAFLILAEYIHQKFSYIDMD